MESTQGHPADRTSVLFLYLLAFLLLLLGAILLIGGIELAALGGSPYYLLTGALVVASGCMLAWRRRAGAWLYGIVVGLTITWAIWEVGFDLWALLPRIGLLVFIGALLLLPWAQRPLRGKVDFHGRQILPGKWYIAPGALAAVAGGALLNAIAGPEQPADPRFQTGFGPYPAAAYGYSDDPGDDWSHFGGDRGGSRFSPLDQVTQANVANLEVAWSVDVGTLPILNATPIKIGDTVYTCNNNNQIFAFDAATGRQRWSYDASNGFGGACRGVTYFSAPREMDTCKSRILTATSTAHLIALDAATGKPCSDFGTNGIVDLTVGMADADGNIIGGYYRVTSAPTLVHGKVVVGGWIFDGQFWGEPSGVIRAFDATTGELAWAWDMGRPDRTGAPPAGEIYTPNTPNSWAPMAADEELGLVFVPTGSPTPDFYGPHRRAFDEKYANAIVALDAETGRARWVFQAVHHDLWDYDVASQPTLLDLKDRSGKLRKAVIQPTKRGEIYVLDRQTGEPIFDVTERPAPQAGKVPEERLSPTQPYSDSLPSFRNADLREKDMWGLSPIDQMLCRIQFKAARYEGPFTPPGLTPAISFPSAFGAINWGGVSVDPQTGVMIVNSSRIAGGTLLITRAEADKAGLKRAVEFGSHRKFIGGGSAQENTPYATKPQGIQNALGLPCTAPPYGFLSAVDLNSGKLLWTRRFGTSLGSGPLGMRFPLALPMGTPTHGGSLVTGSGIVFIGASKDNFLSAFDIKSGKLLWRHELPGAGGTPISYRVGKRQYIVVSAGGQPAIQSRLSTKMVAFALPE